MTIIEKLKKGKKDSIIKKIAKQENIEEAVLIEKIIGGKIVILKNNRYNIKKPIAIGEGLRTKVNVNIGTSSIHKNLNQELKKLKIAVEYGADTVMDLSTGGNLNLMRKSIIQTSPLPVGTVPIYQAAYEANRKTNKIYTFSEDELFNIIEQHAKDGAAFMTVHCGITKGIIETLSNNKRLGGIVSRGGAIILCWMIKNNKENPLYTQFDRLLEIAYKYDITLSLGDGLRPGSINDATDELQLKELLTIGRLVKRARAANVQVMVEGPGHIPINQIEANVKLAKSICDNAPFYVLGPVVTDIAPGYDHVTSAIGGALAGYYGADFLCYVTPAEHLGLPTVNDVKEGTIIARIAAHAADLAKGVKGAIEWDNAITRARRKFDWATHLKLAIDSEKAKSYHDRRSKNLDKECSMCGEYCPLRIVNSI